MRIDLNCDVGESADASQLETETRVLSYVSSVNIACGLHAGGPVLMRRTVRLAKARGVAIGAHPGFRDPDSKGRREQQVSRAEVEDLVAYQVGALRGIAALEEVGLRHVKPHGALYNMAARDGDIALAIARAVAHVDDRLILVGLAGSRLIQAARDAGLAVSQEAFADRGYGPDGTLIPRGQPGAVIQNEPEVISRALSLVRDRTITGPDGQPLAVEADTICVHGDTAGADRLVEAISHALIAAGVHIVPIGKADA